MNNDFYNIIETLPTQAKTSVLYGMIGSLNSRLIYGAQRIVSDCDRNNDNLNDETISGFPRTAHESAMRTELGNAHDMFLNLCAMQELRNELLPMLIEATNNDEVLPLSDTLKFLTTGSRKLPQAELEALAAALEINAADINEAFNLEAEVQRQRMLSSMERILTTALLIPGDTSHEYAFDALSADVQESLLNKLKLALNKARNNVVIGVIQRRSTADLGDIPLIKAAIIDVEWMLRNAIKEAPISTRNIENVVDKVITHEKDKPKTNKKSIAVNLGDMQSAYSPI